MKGDDLIYAAYISMYHLIYKKDYLYHFIAYIGQEMEGEALKARPKRPLPAIFRFRMDHLEIMPQGQRNGQFTKQLWDSLTPQTRSEYQRQFRKELDKWRIDMETWKQIYNIDKIPRLTQPTLRKRQPYRAIGKAMAILTENRQSNRPKPKRPMPAMFKFRMQHLHEMPEGQRGAKHAKQLWDSLPVQQRQYYIDDFDKEINKWRQNLSEWKMQIDQYSEPSQMVDYSKVTIDTNHVKREEKQQKKENGKPKRPIPATFRFRLDNLDHIPIGQRGAKQVKQRWDSLDKEQRQAYDEEYRRDLKRWKTEMEEWKKAHPNYHIPHTHEHRRFVSRGVQTQPLRRSKTKQKSR